LKIRPFPPNLFPTTQTSIIPERKFGQDCPAKDRNNVTLFQGHFIGRDYCRRIKPFKKRGSFGDGVTLE
jgi:hypothetical protein